MKEKTNENSMKEKIKSKAFSLMAKKGLKDISMREIAEACGVTKPVLYYYFKDKEDLCYSLITEKNIISNEKLKKFAEKASFEDILLFMFTKYMEDIRHKDVFPFVVHVSSYLLSNPVLGKRFDVIKEQNVNTISDILEKEYKKGSITEKGKEMAMHLIFANMAHMVLNSYENEVRFGPDYPKEMVRAILKAIDYREK